MSISETASPHRNPYESPVQQTAFRRRLKRFPAFIAGTVALAMGAGFSWVMTVLVLIGSMTMVEGRLEPSRVISLVGLAVFQATLLLTWIATQRHLYRLPVPLLWTLAIACGLLIPVFVAVLLAVLFYPFSGT